ncbi:hypothetical protein CKM354_000193900 [Cercospora kikuchii]|uniref:inorganic diphosphatase n=1 Tax=Cercospora kikuchii TaxID=84275 RepID=A0A9P3F955_9PEZI|nr:uncharacterized protein CKM354_000193900 [Cercospora kikuchii]GIZ38523.1 hypothetical protein CKM354_000193900 [Cercospora kikuchii]
MLSRTLFATLPALLVSAQQYSLTETGGRNTLDYRLHLKVDGKPASFWHDVALYPQQGNASIVNFVVEIPRWEDGKIEIRRDEPLNPIFHDDNEEGPRFVESIWPHRSYPFLYGSIPQTWESPNFNHSFTNFPGDNDPVDAFDIGQDIGYVGQIKQVKILGGLAVIDGDETDWKILVIDVNDPLAPYVNEIQDLEQYRPGVAGSYRQWFRTYKVPRGDGTLTIAGENYQNATFTSSIIAESHEWWKELVAGEVDSNEINYNQTSSAEYNNSYVEPGSVWDELEIPRWSTYGQAAQKPERFNRWYYLDGNEELIVLPGDYAPPEED